MISTVIQFEQALFFALPHGLREAHALNPCHFPENDAVLLWEAIAVYMVPIVGQLIQSVGHFPQVLLIDHGYMQEECYRKSNRPQDRGSELIEIDRPNVSAHAASHHGRYLFPDFI